MLYPLICLGVMRFNGATMAHNAFITLFSLLGLLFPSEGMADELFLEKVEAISGDALPEIREFIIRKLGCEHWESQGAPISLKDEDVRRAMRHLRCASLESDENFLRRTYARHEASMNALNATRGMQASTASPFLQSSSSALGF
jgi:hypothetical protein